MNPVIAAKIGDTAVTKGIALVEKKPSLLWIPVIAPIAVAGSFLYLMSRVKKSISETIGLSDTDQEIENQKFLLQKAFDPNYYKNHLNKSGARLLTTEEANKRAADIEDSWGIINDDEPRIYGVFGTLSSWSQVSQIADSYYKQFNASLGHVLEEELHEDEFKKVISIIKTKPHLTYR